jgi:hypothetical protein
VPDFHTLRHTALSPEQNLAVDHGARPRGSPRRHVWIRLMNKSPANHPRTQRPEFGAKCVASPYTPPAPGGRGRDASAPPHP